MVRKNHLEVKMDKENNECENYTENVPSSGNPTAQTNTSPGSTSVPENSLEHSINPIESILRRHLLRFGLSWPPANAEEVNRFYRIVPPVRVNEVIEEEEEELTTRNFQAWEPPQGMPYPPSTPSSSSSESEDEATCELKIEEVSIQFEEIDLNQIQIEKEIEDPLLIDPLYGSSPAA